MRLRFAVVLSLFGVACTFDATVAPSVPVRCDASGACPVGYQCRARFGVCTPTSAADGEAPRLVSGRVTPLIARRGTTLTFDATLSEALGLAPNGTFFTEAGPRSVVASNFDDTATPQVRFTHVVDEADAEGAATFSLDAIDRFGNEAIGLAVATAQLDFTPPTVRQATFAGLRSADGGVFVLKPSDIVSVRVVASEALASGGALTATGPCGDTPVFSLVGSTAGLVDFEAVSSGTEGCTYELSWSSARDLAGNVAPAPLPLGLRYHLDGVAPAVSNLQLRPLDGGASAVTLASRVQAFSGLAVHFDIGEVPASVQLKLDEAVVTPCEVRDCAARDGGVHCACGYVVGAADAEGTHVFAVTTRDEAGNQQTSSVPVTFDFTAPRLVGAPSIQLSPPQGCPLERVSSLSSGATARLFVSTDEPATVQFSTAPEALNVTTDSATNTAFSFSARVVVGRAPRRLPVDLVLRTSDAVGNEATVVLDGGLLVIDTQPPLAPDTSPGAIVLRRAPWGDATGAPRFDVWADAGAATPGVVVRVVDGAADAGGELGRADVDALGAFHASLLAADRRTVSLVALDEACNASPRVDVKDIEWVATLGQKIGQSLIENPHQLFEARAFRRTLEQPYATLATDSSAAATPGAGGYAVAAGPVWVPRARRAFDLGGGGLRQQAMAYDQERDRVVSFGGNDNNGPNDVVLELNGECWVPIAPLDPEGDDGPLERAESALAYDTVRARTVLFGGRSRAGDVLDDTWEWDGVSWRRLSSRVTRPPARAAHVMAFDRGRGETVLFGGSDNTTSLNDTWAWNGASWQQLSSAQRPPARTGAALAYDAPRASLVLFGGENQAGVLSDTWLFRDGGWAAAPGPNPGPRVVHAMAGDDAGVVLVGGFYNFSTRRDVWFWDGTWRQASVPDAGPSAYLSGLVFDSARQRFVQAGGTSDTQFLRDDTWFLQRTGPASAVWSPAPSTFPAALSDSRAVYDERRRVTVLLGGIDDYGLKRHHLEWSGSSYRALPVPPWAERSAVAAAYDATRGLVVMHGGFGGFYANASHSLQDTWVTDGGAWAQVVGANGLPPSFNSMVFDRLRNRMVLFGTTDPLMNEAFAQTMEFDGTRWSQRADAGPTPRSGAAMTWDSVSGRTLLFGGSRLNERVLSNELWAYDSGSWAQLSTVVQPSARYGTSLVLDEARRRLVLFGGSDVRSQNLNDTWEFDLSAPQWVKVPLAIAPVARQAAAMAYDSDRRVVVLQGGGPTRDARQTEDLWEYGLEAQGRPALVFEVAFGAANAEPGAVVQSIGASLVAGGSGPGVEVWVARRNTLMLEASGPGSLGAMSAVTWSTSDAARLGELLVGPRRALSLTLTSSGRNDVASTTPARVSLDYAEVTVRYRRP